MATITTGAKRGQPARLRKRWRIGARGFNAASLRQAEVPQRRHRSADLHLPPDRLPALMQAAAPSARASEDRRRPGSAGPCRKAAISVAQTLSCSTAMRALRSTGACAHQMQSSGAGHPQRQGTRARWSAIAACNCAGLFACNIKLKCTGGVGCLPISSCELSQPVSATHLSNYGLGFERRSRPRTKPGD